MLALSQLSYGPSVVAPQCSRELELLSPIDPAALVITSRTDPKHDLGSRRQTLERQEVAAVELGAIGSKRIDLVRGVEASDKSMSLSS
jgi:hypothetical protein